MGIFHNSKVDDEKIFEKYEHLLIPGEEIIFSLKRIRDLIILTNARLIVIDKQGVTGKKKMITNYTLNRIVKFEVENSPYLDIDSEVAIYFGGQEEPLQFELSKGTNVLEFSKLLFEQMSVKR